MNPERWPELKVLVVDESRFFRGVVGSVLRAARVDHCREAPNIATALQILEDFAPHLVICESNLGGSDWVRLHEQICARSRAARPRFILIASTVDKAVVEDAIQRQVSDIVLKPISASLLLSRIAQVFRMEDAAL